MKLLEKLKEKINLIKNNKEEKEANKKNKSFKIEKNMMIKLILLAIISMIIAVVFELFAYENTLRQWHDSVGYRYSAEKGVDYSVSFSFIRTFLFWSVFIFAGLHFIVKPKKIYEFICDKRYIIAGLFLVLVMALKLNGGSLSRVDYYVGLQQNGDEIREEFGVPRDIRSDEWGTQSLYILSQKYDNYATKGDTLRGTKTDMFTLVNSPVKSPLAISKPFLLMFILLDNLSMGYSFYWFARITLMCLATYEVMRILTDKNKVLSLVGTILIAFSAATQWWYCLDVLIWGEVILVLFNLFFESKKKITKILCAIGEVVAVLSYIFILYPGWMVSFAYIFIPVLVLIVYKNIKQENFKRVDVIDITMICVAVLAIAAVIALWLITSYDTIVANTSTVYPGNRIATGGGENSLFAYFYNWFMPYEAFKTNISSHNYFENGIEKYSNQCENATMLSLFPIPMILALVYVLRNKDKDGKRDLFLIISLIVSTFLSIYAIIGFPEFLSKITLLHLAIGMRVAVPIAAINVYMLMYIIGKVSNDNSIKLIDNKIIVLIISLVMTCMCLLGDGNNYLEIWQIVVSTIVFFIVFYLSLNLNNNKKKIALLIMISVITLIGGLTVNPIVRTVDVIENNHNLSSTLQKYVAEEPDSIWVGNNLPFILSNYMVANGVNTLSSSNVYPNEDMYKTLFGDNKDAENIWNRYHHLEIYIEDEETSLELVAKDYIRLVLNYKDLNKLGVDYILTAVNFDIEKPYMNVELKEIIDGKYMIYKVLEQDAIGHMDEKIENYREALPNAVWLTDGIYDNELKELIYDNDIFPIISEIKDGFTNEILEEFNIRYILTKKNLCIERPDLTVRERQVIGEFIIYEVVNVEG